MPLEDLLGRFFFNRGIPAIFRMDIIDPHN